MRNRRTYHLFQSSLIGYLLQKLLPILYSYVQNISFLAHKHDFCYLIAFCNLMFLAKTNNLLIDSPVPCLLNHSPGNSGSQKAASTFKKFTQTCYCCHICCSNVNHPNPISHTSLAAAESVHHELLERCQMLLFNNQW